MIISVDMIYEISMTYLKKLPVSAVFFPSEPVWTHPSWTGTHHLQWNIRCTRRIPRSVAESGGYGAGTEFMKTLGH